MAKFIDAEAFRGEMQEYVFPITNNNLMGAADAYYRILHLLEDTPTADVVGVVRCKECRLRKTDRCPMYYEEDIEWDDDGYIEIDTIFHDNTTDDSFCSYGERSDT